MIRLLAAFGFLCLLLSGIFLAISVVAADVDSVDVTPEMDDVDTLDYAFDNFEIRRRATKISKPESVPFGVGEKFVFSIEYSFIKAGTASLEIKEIELIDGHPCYRIYSLAKSGRTFSLFFRVHDQVNSYMDVYQLFTRRFTKSLEEGNYRANQEINFDHVNGIATYHNGKEYEIPPNVQDVLSAFYYTRCLDLEVGSEIAIETHADRKNYPLLVQVLRKETVEVPAGTFDCLVVEPVLQSTGIFKQKGKLTVWLTDDDNKIPVLMKSKVFIGSIDAKLRSYQPGIRN